MYLNLRILFFLICFLILSCNESDQLSSESIYNFADNQILGNPIIAEISEGEKLSYIIECDSLINLKENILLFNNVNIQIFNDMNEHITDLFSDKATIIGRSQGVENNQTYNFNKGDMIAEGNVEIISILNDYRLKTDRIKVYNSNKCNILIDEDEQIELIRENDILNGFGFKSDCEMKVWHINKPSGTIEKGVDK